jgi:nitrate/TMAO reductase-like tetraheme cytochrome c subunit
MPVRSGSAQETLADQTGMPPTKRGEDMKMDWNAGAILRSAFLLVSAALAAVTLSASAYAAAPEPKPLELSAADKTCLGCHGGEGLKKELTRGESLDLHVDAAGFANSVHRPIGCTGCHTQINVAEHPAKTRKIASARAFTLEQSENCRACHDGVFKSYELSVHAQRAKEGNAIAPTCATCHSPHAVLPPAIQESSNSTCLTCHAGVADVHAKWLPNAARHLDVVSCSACHAPAARRKVDLRLVDATGKRVADTSGTLQFEKLARAADADGNGLDPMELRTLLAEVSRRIPKATFEGHLEVRNGIEAHELPAKANASQNCSRCHSDAAAPFQMVTVSVIGPNSRMERYDAHPNVLTSAATVDVLRGFYAIGGTRIRIFDVLLALGLIAGISVPALHILIRRLTRRNNKHPGETT